MSPGQGDRSRMSIPHPSVAAARASGGSSEGSSKELFKWESLLLPLLLLD